MSDKRTLNDFVKDNSKFLRLANGESFEGVYRGYKITSNQFDPEKETVVYKLEYTDGKPAFFQTASVAVARVLGKFKGGETVKIVRHGEGTKTKYEIKSPDIQITEEEMQPDEDVPF